MRVLVPVALISIGVATPVWSGPSDDLVFCSRLASPRERLACYEAAARIADRGRMGAKPPAVTPPPPDPGPRAIAVASARQTHEGSYVFVFGGYNPGLTGSNSEFGKLNASAVGLGAGYNFQYGSLVFGPAGRLHRDFGERQALNFATESAQSIPIFLQSGILPAAIPSGIGRSAPSARPLRLTSADGAATFPGEEASRRPIGFFCMLAAASAFSNLSRPTSSRMARSPATTSSWPELS
jgi:hypothetical protein